MKSIVIAILVVLGLCVLFWMLRDNYDKKEEPCKGKEEQKGYILPKDKEQWTAEDYEIDFIRRESDKK